MKWRTEVAIAERKGYFTYEHSALSIGSCFADEVGNRLKEGGMDISVNPFGIIFNPVSIMQLIQNALDGNLREDLILSRDMKYFHYGYHSKVSGTDQADLIKNIEAIQFTAQRRLLQGDHLFITFGTAWVYRLIEQSSVVANCHKMPGQLFSKELIDLGKLITLSTQLFSRLFEENPKLRVLISVSPVRHSKDGLHENNISKGILHLLAKHLTDSFERVVYFPAYELVVDDLRDYRFFKEDLVHPNKQAVDYVFERFKDVYFDQATNDRFSLLEKINTAQLHHFMNATIDEVRKHEEYIGKLKQQLDLLGKHK